MVHNIPDVGEINLAKLSGGMISGDNCSPAMKVKRLLAAAVQDAVNHSYTLEQWEALSTKEQAASLLVLEGDCWNHLRNVWIKSMSGALTGRLRDSLRFELETIDSRLRVGTALVGVLRACDKEFSLCANYPKGHGDMFFEWVARCYPNILLYHVVSTEGGRQDMVCEGAGPLYMNRQIWVEFLDERLRIPGADPAKLPTCVCPRRGSPRVKSRRGPEPTPHHRVSRTTLKVVVFHCWIAPPTYSTPLKSSCATD